MTPSAAEPGPAGDPARPWGAQGWAEGEPAEAEQPQPTADEQYTAQLPRRHGMGSFPYPPATAEPVGQQPPEPALGQSVPVTPPPYRTAQYPAEPYPAQPYSTQDPGAAGYPVSPARPADPSRPANPGPAAHPGAAWTPGYPEQGQGRPWHDNPAGPYPGAEYQQSPAGEPTYPGYYQGQPADAATDVDLPRDQPPAGRHQPPPRGSHLPPYREPFAGPAGSAGTTPGAAGGGAGAPTAGAATPATGSAAPRTGPRKLTVTRVAAFRSRELTTRGVQIFQRAATADGADRSGLTALTYAVMGNYAVDAALAVALANTLFFAAATAESTSKVLLYLLITVAPFAVIAPLIGPALDKLQHGRRIALGASSFARALLAVVMALNFDSWVLYPCALGMLVLSKSFSVLKAAITPRVLPPDMTLVKTNSRMTVFGLLAGGVAGAFAAAFSWAFGSTGALIFTALLSIAGGWLCLRIPAWVESTAGEIPVDGVGPKAKRAFPLSVTTTMWANGTIRVETGFLALFIAFVIKSEYTESSGFTQLLLLGVVGLAAGAGGFIGNGLGSQLPLSKPETVSILALGATAVTTLIAVLIPGLATAAIVGLVG
ncbi:MAG: hypothetical protein ABWZ98_12930, partial [Nakamurella sp.]